MVDHTCPTAQPGPRFACPRDGRSHPGTTQDGFSPAVSRPAWWASVVRTAIVAAAPTCLLLASCSDPISRAEERRRSVYDHGGTNREVCAEARKVKAAYIDAGRRDDVAWLAVDIHCTGVEGPKGELIAKQQSESAMAGRR